AWILRANTVLGQRPLERPAVELKSKNAGSVDTILLGAWLQHVGYAGVVGTAPGPVPVFEAVRRTDGGPCSRRFLQRARVVRGGLSPAVRSGHRPRGCTRVPARRRCVASGRLLGPAAGGSGRLAPAPRSRVAVVFRSGVRQRSHRSTAHRIRPGRPVPSAAWR